MPTSRTPTDHTRPFRITPAAIARWRQVRPHGIDVGPAHSGFEDEELALLFGESVLLAQRHEDMEALFEALERAVRAKDA